MAIVDTIKPIYRRTHLGKYGNTELFAYCHYLSAGDGGMDLGVGIATLDGMQLRHMSTTVWKLEYVPSFLLHLEIGGVSLKTGPLYAYFHGSSHIIISDSKKERIFEYPVYGNGVAHSYAETIRNVLALTPGPNSTGLLFP